MKSVDPNIKVDVTVPHRGPNDQAGFENPAGGKVAAAAMYEKGADVVYHAAGKSGLGVFQAAAAAGDGKWAIGVDSDQYLTAPKSQKPHILTSMLKRIDTAVSTTIKAFEDGSPPAGLRHLRPQDRRRRLRHLRWLRGRHQGPDRRAAEQIKSGEIKVPTDPGKVK